MADETQTTEHVLTGPFRGLYQCPQCGHHSSYTELKRPTEKESNKTAQAMNAQEIAGMGLKPDDLICPVCSTLAVRRQ